MNASLTTEQIALLTVSAGIGAVALGASAMPHWQGPSWRPWHSGPGIRLAGQFITDQDRMRHSHIVGATGSGKTVLIEHLLFKDLARGYGALIIDPKGEREFFDRVQAFCTDIGRKDDLHLISATHAAESARWNPCGLGNASELQTKFYNSAIYSEPHYAKACEAALLSAFNELIQGCPDGFTIPSLIAALEQKAKATKDKNIEGLFLDLFNLAQGEWRDILCCGQQNGHDPRPMVSLLDVTRHNKILFVDLPTESKAVQSSRIGRLMTQEIMLISGLRKTNPEIRSKHPFAVFIDEFDAFATPSIATFINKGRSSGFMIHLAHQTLSDLDKVSPEFTGQILGNCNVRFIFRQDHPDDAETWSRVFGTRRTVKVTHQIAEGSYTGTGSQRETQEFKIGPDTIKELGVGRCVFSMKNTGTLKRLKIPAPLNLGSTGTQVQTTPVVQREPGVRTEPRVIFEELGGITPPQATDAYEFIRRES